MQYLTHEGTLQQKHGQWGTTKCISNVVTVLPASRVVYFNDQTYDACDNHKMADPVSHARNYRHLTRRNNAHYEISFSVGDAGLLSTIVFWTMQSTF